ncbi:MAG: MFS transporter [Syntrophaceae bacterium]|nr:MFS transporter [Syntrophaceae bacterium]
MSDPLPTGSKQMPGYLLVPFLALLASFPALATDLYLPALPSMSKELNCSVSLVNLSLVLFFVFISVSSIIWGPLTDKYGRRPPLLIGMPLFVLSSIACVFSQTVYQLIAARVFQAIGAGAAMAANLAIVKDIFPGKKRENMLALMSFLNGMIPIIAPSIGALVLRLTSWRGAFVVLTGIGALVWLLIFALKETNTQLSNLSILNTTARLLVVLKNPHFARLIITFSIISIPLLGYIGISSFIFVDRFGVSEEVFALYFGAIASFFVFGGPIYLILSRYLKPVTIITICYFGSLISGILILAIGQMGPLFFGIAIACGFLSVSVSRPPSSSLLLEQQDKDTGSASSLIQASFVLTGSAGMYLVSLDWSNRILILGMMSLILNLAGLFIWFYSKSRCRLPAHFK